MSAMSAVSGATSDRTPTLGELWKAADFHPNPEQKKAITFLGRPLFIKAGPGSGKTRVLLWRTVHLLVHHHVKPQDIFLSTFTEKAARQLEEGLRGLLALVTERTGEYFDLANMYIGTLHSLCQRITTERRFSPHRQRPRAPLLMDELAQYLYLSRNRNWNTFLSELGWKGANMAISQLFDGFESPSRHRAASSCISLFNRLSEECLDPKRIRKSAGNPTLRKLIDFYSLYRKGLEEQQPPLTDFALLQQAALKVLDELDAEDGGEHSGQLFKHVIIDEYQDTNTVQERLVFRLSAHHKNICVVDDAQALSRFRGATVENFVQFPERCLRNLGTEPHVIELGKNYRSRKAIVDFYSEFIKHPCCDWRRDGSRKALYRVLKRITAERKDDGVCVIGSSPGAPPAVCNEIATLVKRILKSGKVEDPNQIAFLFPSLKARSVQRMKDALIASGMKVYAPRAGTFLEVDEAREMLGLFGHVFGKPEFGEMRGRDYENFREWIDSAYRTAKSLRMSDSSLNRFVEARQHEIRQVVYDYTALVKPC